MENFEISRTTRYRLRRDHSKQLKRTNLEVEDDILIGTSETSWTDEPQDNDICIEELYWNPVESFVYSEDDEEEMLTFEEEQYEEENNTNSILNPHSLMDTAQIDNVGVSPLLYDHSQLSMSSSSVLTMKYAMKHNLSMEALGDLLQLLKLHCPTPNKCISSVYLFKKQFLQYSPTFTVHHFCCVCFSSMNLDTKTCPNESCKCTSPPLSFIELSVEEQLRKILSRNQNYEKIKEKSMVVHNDSRNDKYSDICSSKLYWDLQSKEKTQGNILTFSFNTDGIPVFKSSNYSFWPAYLTINELPFHLRHGNESRILAGLWYGSEKPNMKLFLKPITDSLYKLSTEGFTIYDFHCKAFLLCFTADLPAKALTLNFIQFNGYWGCGKCKQKGERVQCEGTTGSTQTYPYIESNPSGPKRNHDETILEATRAIETNESNVNGVKGPSWLAAMPHFDMIRGSSVDYMHCVLLGVCRQFLKLWLEAKYHKRPWYFGNRTQEVDSHLLIMKPPSEFRRTPRSIDSRKFWKAHEIRAWLFHYSPVVLYNFLPAFYYQHHLLLVEGVYLLCTDSVTAAAIKKATMLLQHFCYMVTPLYGEYHMSANIHGLLHLPEVTEDLGPLWAHSCFPYENANGEILKLFHGSQSIEKQVIKRIGELQMMADVAKGSLLSGSYEEEFYTKMNSSQRELKKDVVPLNSSLAVGNEKPGEITQKERELIVTTIGFVPDTYKFFGSIYLPHENKVISSKDFTKAVKRNDSCITYKDSTSILQYGLLLKVILLNEEYFAILQPLREAAFVLCEDTTTNAKFNDHYKAFHNPRFDDPLTILPVVNIVSKCIYLNTKINDFVFISSFVNSFELE